MPPPSNPNPLPPPPPIDEEILAANRAFYDAIAARSLAAMDALWARRRAVACIHPGWDALVDRDSIIQSWLGIFRGTGALPSIDGPVHLMKVGAGALVVLREAVGGHELAATNAFAREDGGWRIVFHQASPVAAREPGVTARRASLN